MPPAGGGGAKPPNCALRPEHDALFAQLPAKVDAGGTELYRRRRRGLGWLGAGTGALLLGLVDAVALFGQLVLDTLYLMRHPRELPWRELSATIYKAGVRAMPVAALVGFLIGVVLSYLSSLQLRNFGADLYIVNILGLGTTRELGPVLVAVLVAGRSGSAMAAQIGVMRVTEEIDALAVMGISRSQRLVLPKIRAGAGHAPPGFMDHGHGALATHPAHKLAAGADNPRRIFQAERPGHVRGGHFAHAVAHNGVWGNPPTTP